MPVTVGDIYFTSFITDPHASGNDSFSFVTTTNLVVGDTITFHQPEALGDASFTYTVGAGGLSALDQVVIRLPSNTSVAIVADPSGGSVSGMTGSMSITDSDNFIAGAGGQVIAAISNGGDWNQPLTNLGTVTDTLTVTGLSNSALNTFIANNPTLASPAIQQLDSGGAPTDNAMFSGTDISTQGDNPAFWTITDTAQDHTAPNVNGTTYATQAANIFCFAAGTLVTTPKGDTAVEDLQIGDVIRTETGITQVKWLGRHTVNKRNCGPRMQPVRIRAGALGHDLPHSDLTVTADHGMIFDTLVINASALVNHTTIDYVPMAELPDHVTYYHIETAAHDVILANGTPSETFVDALSRAQFDNYQDYLNLFGAERLIPEMSRPRITSQRLLPERLKTRLGISSTVTDFRQMVS